MDPAGRNSTYTCKFAIFNAKWHFVLGEYFIRNHYTIYDLQNMRIGIAPLKNFAYHKNVQHEEAAKVDTAPKETPKIIPVANKTIEKATEAPAKKPSGDQATSNNNSTLNATAAAEGPATKTTEIDNAYIMLAMVLLFFCACGLGAYSFRKRRLR
jgi:hypothetical protein